MGDGYRQRAVTFPEIDTLLPVEHRHRPGEIAIHVPSHQHIAGRHRRRIVELFGHTGHGKVLPRLRVLGRRPQPLPWIRPVGRSCWKPRRSSAPLPRTTGP